MELDSVRYCRHCYKKATAVVGGILILAVGQRHLSRWDGYEQQDPVFDDIEVEQPGKRVATTDEKSHRLSEIFPN